MAKPQQPAAEFSQYTLPTPRARYYSQSQPSLHLPPLRPPYTPFTPPDSIERCFNDVGDAQREIDLQRLRLLCLPAPDRQRVKGALRPERLESSALVQLTSHKAWERVVRQFQESIYRDSGSLDDFLARMEVYFPWPPPYIPPDRWINQFSRHGALYCKVWKVLGAVSAILFDQECSAEPIRRVVNDAEWSAELPEIDKLFTADALPYLFEYMLLVDYGIGALAVQPPTTTSARSFFERELPHMTQLSKYLVGFAERCRTGRIPEQKEWKFLSQRLPDRYSSCDLADAAIMLYYYHTQRETADDDRFKQGFTGYKGILQELLREDPAKGADRLMRKLSVDVHCLIPKCVRGRERRRWMILAAVNIASQRGIRLHASDAKKVCMDGGWNWLDCVHAHLYPLPAVMTGISIPVTHRVKEQENELDRVVEQDDSLP